MQLQDGAANGVILSAQRPGTVCGRLPRARLTRPAIRASRPAGMAHAARSFRCDRPVLRGGIVGGPCHWHPDQHRVHPISLTLAGNTARSSLRLTGCGCCACRLKDGFRASRLARGTASWGRIAKVCFHPILPQAEGIVRRAVTGSKAKVMQRQWHLPAGGAFTPSNPQFVTGITLYFLTSSWFRQYRVEWFCLLATAC